MKSFHRAYLTAKNYLLNGATDFDAAEQAGLLYGLGYREILQIWMKLNGG